MRFLSRFGIRPDQWKIKVTAVVFRLFLRPQRLHDLDRFPRLRPTMWEVSSHQLGFLPQPARANAEQETAATVEIEGRDLFSQEERIAFRHQRNASAELDRRRHCGGSRQGDIGVRKM